MRKVALGWILAGTALWGSKLAAHDQVEQGIVVGTPFKSACQSIERIPDACAIAEDAAALLAPTYRNNKKHAAEGELAELGYFARYYPARHGLFGDLTDVFLVARPASNRIYLVVTGTESKRDWYENAKAQAYATEWRDGYYYTPPGHAGFRSGALNVIRTLLRPNEFDSHKLGDCSEMPESKLARFICDSEVRKSPEDRIDIVLAGHSRGAGIVQLIAAAMDGREIVMPGKNGREADVERQQYWPLQLAAVVGFAMPQSIYTRTDGYRLPEGAPNQWEVYGKVGVAERSMTFLNERDIVPLLSLGLGSQIGYRFRIEADSKAANRIVYAGFGSPNDMALWQAHGSGGYCQDVLTSLGRLDNADGSDRCDARSFSQGIGHVGGEVESASSPTPSD